MKYILGIDTTFHTCGAGLVDENGKVFANEKIDIDFDDENAKKFLSFHTKNALRLIKPLFDKYSGNISLISVVNQEGTFHAMPVGVIIANTLSYFMNKKIIGVNHEVSHLYANWLERNENEFIFPIVSLNASGAHSNIYLMKNHKELNSVGKIVWQDEQARFNGLGAFFDSVCFLLGIKFRKGEGGMVLDKLAEKGESKFYDYFKNLEIKKENDMFKIQNLVHNISGKLRELEYTFLSGEDREKFKHDFAKSLLDGMFDVLLKILMATAVEFGAREIHLAGGLAANKILKIKTEDLCHKNNLGFKAPVKSEFCGDNGAMTALAGYYKWKYMHGSGNGDFLPIEPSEWYYKYYADYFSS